MTMRDKIADIIDETLAYDYDGSVSGITDAADAILGALPDMIAPLVWMRNGSHWAGGYGYVVRKLGSQYTLTIRNEHGRQFETIEEAQEHADTHHRAAGMAIFTGETQ
jgi:hypothetical protein